jgi:hypothetical protein
MSWKSIVIAGLLCVLASPALAVPTVSATLLGLDTAGNWVWQVNVDPDDALFTNPADTPDRGTGGSTAIEVGVEATGRGVVSAAKNATNFPSDNPGVAPAGWGADIDGVGGADTGVAFSAATDRVVAYLGSDFFGTLNFGGAPANGQPKEAFRVHTERPTPAALTTTLNFSGAYTAGGAAGGALGAIAQAGAQTGFTLGPASKAVVVGNTNLDNIVNIVDGGRVATNFGGAFNRWQDGDFNGDGIVNIVDGGALATNFGAPDPNWTVAGSTTLPTTPGAGSGGGAGIAAPEPSTLILLVLGGLVAGFRRRFG